jgi:hypothetical protein
MVTEPAVPVVPERAKAVIPLETPEEDSAARAEQERAAEEARADAEQRLRERIREEVRAELEAEMSEEQKGPGLAKASPDFQEIEPRATASEEEQDQAIEKNSEEVTD